MPTFAPQRELAGSMVGLRTLNEVALVAFRVGQPASTSGRSLDDLSQDSTRRRWVDEHLTSDRLARTWIAQ